MSDLIDRQKTLEKIYQLPIIDRDAYEFYRDVRESIKSMPSAEKAGKWTLVPEEIAYKCSCCGCRYSWPFPSMKYCGECGAKMEVTE